MQMILRARDQIYNEFHRSAGPKYFFTNAPRDDFAAYYTSMYLIADTGESMQVHQGKDFSRDPLESYLEFWGVMQAINIQQDAIVELHQVVVGTKPNTAGATHWHQLRDLRIQCAGHPVKKTHGVPAPQRTFMGRIPGRTYASVTYEVFDASTQRISHPHVNLGSLISGYDVEGSAILTDVLRAMQHKWP